MVELVLAIGLIILILAVIGATIEGHKEWKKTKKWLYDKEDQN